ncbi:hypothetical protein Gasu2_09030 [Galdieria sulphuraria]|nr:hypothetical protein Gasu2_09030 [Galdieria sulphuraria]
MLTVFGVRIESVKERNRNESYRDMTKTRVAIHPIVLVEYSFSSKQLDWFWPTKEDSQFENKSKALTSLES